MGKLLGFWHIIREYIGIAIDSNVEWFYFYSSKGIVISDHDNHDDHGLVAVVTTVTHKAPRSLFEIPGCM